MNIDGEGNLKVNIVDMLDSLSDECKLELIESLSCDEAVIKHVMDQVFEGCTENGYHGSISCTALDSNNEIDKARVKAASRASHIARKEIKRLRKDAEYSRKLSDAGWNEYHKLYNRVHGLNQFSY